MDGYTIPQVADLVGVTRQEVREAVESGLLPAVRRDGRWWLQPAEVETLRRRLEPPPPVRVVDDPDDDLAVLEEKIAALEERVAALEAGDPPPVDDDQPMRSALTPLFKNPRR